MTTNERESVHTAAAAAQTRQHCCEIDARACAAAAVASSAGLTQPHCGIVDGRAAAAAASGASSPAAASGAGPPTAGGGAGAVIPGGGSRGPDGAAASGPRDDVGDHARGRVARDRVLLRRGGDGVADGVGGGQREGGGGRAPAVALSAQRAGHGVDRRADRLDVDRRHAAAHRLVATARRVHAWGRPSRAEPSAARQMREQRTGGNNKFIALSKRRGWRDWSFHAAGPRLLCPTAAACAIGSIRSPTATDPATRRGCSRPTAWSQRVQPPRESMTWCTTAETARPAP